MYVVGQFVLVFAHHPSGYVSAYYNLETGGVTVNYESSWAQAAQQNNSAFLSAEYQRNKSLSYT